MDLQPDCNSTGCNLYYMENLIARIRLNKHGLYPTGGTKKTGHKDLYFESICVECKKVIKKSESKATIPGKGDFHWYCQPGLKKGKDGKT